MAEGVDYLEDIKTVLKKYEAEIAALRKECKVPDDDPLVDNLLLYRFLKGWSFDHAKASSSLTNMLTWRKEKKANDVRSKIADLEQDKFPHYDNIIKVWPHNIKHGSTKNGQPLSFVLAGKVRPDRMVSLLSKDELLEYQMYQCESNAEIVARLSKTTGKVIRNTKVFDLDGLGVHFLNKGFVEYFRALTLVSQNNYPEMLGRIYLINVPWAFQTFWRLITPMLYPQTIAKIQVLGSDWKDKLKEAIDEKYLPPQHGGTCNECKKGCVVMVDPDAGFQKVDIGRRDKFELQIKIESKGAIASWEWRVAHYDVNFSVRFIADSDKKEKTVEEAKNYTVQGDTRSGGLTADEPGTLILYWDNTYSLLTGKTVFYRVDVASVSELTLDSSSS